MAHANNRAVRQSVGKNLATWSMGIAGSVWSAATGDVLGGAVGGLGLLTDVVSDSRDNVGAYSYLFSVNTAFGRGTEW